MAYPAGGIAQSQSSAPRETSLNTLFNELEKFTEIAKEGAERLSRAADRIANPPPLQAEKALGENARNQQTVEERLRSATREVEKLGNRLHGISERLDAVV